MNIAIYCLFPNQFEWHFMPESVAFYLLFVFYPGFHTGDLIQQHLGIGNELHLVDGSMLRFVVLE